MTQMGEASYCGPVRCFYGPHRPHYRASAVREPRILLEVLNALFKQLVNMATIESPQVIKLPEITYTKSAISKMHESRNDSRFTFTKYWSN